MSLRYDDNSMFGSRTTWHIAPVVAVAATGTRLHASYGTGFKAPSLEDLFESFPAFFFFANPDLKPESSAGYDVGVDQTLGPVSAGATWFHNNIKNLIETDPVTFSTDVNIGKARTEGMEAYLAWQALDTLMLRTDYTYTLAEDAVLHQELVRRPRHKASAERRAGGPYQISIWMPACSMWEAGLRRQRAISPCRTSTLIPIGPPISRRPMTSPKISA